MNPNPRPRLKSLDALHRNGTLRKDRHRGQHTPAAPPGRPTKPADLDTVASQAWDEAVTALDTMQNVHTVDGLVLAQYARLVGETEGIGVQQAALRLRLDTLNTAIGGLTGSDLGQAIGQITTLAKLHARYTDQLRNGRAAIRLFLTELGLTPASRNRIRVPDDAPADVDHFAVLAATRPILVNHRS